MKFMIKAYGAPRPVRRIFVEAIFVNVGSRKYGNARELYNDFTEIEDPKEIEKTKSTCHE